MVLQCLNKHRKPDCKFGRILNTQDFKHLARKVHTMEQALRRLILFNVFIRSHLVLVYVTNDEAFTVEICNVYVFHISTVV